MMTELECRKILGLRENYTFKEAKQAYRQKVLTTHPDRNRGDNTQFLIVNKAFEEIQKYLQYKDPVYKTQQARQNYQRKTQADQAYKRKVKEDIYWKKYSEAKRKRYDSDFKENLKFGFLLIAIIILICMLIGKKFDPEFNNSKIKQKNYEQNED